ncbi:MAG: ABC transporter ATP-binding protein [Candidatus Bathyarchaeota archaeon]|nr:ABC transporter ATP-binding protein [Candidatus Bathyarchaeota archaeon]
MTRDQILLKSVTKYYDPLTRALNNINLNISKGEWSTIIGPSGSGKTTLLNLMSGLDNLTSGTIIVNDTNITGMDQKLLTKFRRENMGLIFQQYHLIPYLNALENVTIAQYFHSKVDEAAAREALERVGLGHRLEHRPSQLSGGEQQRVCIARSLINKPEIIFLDEPTGNLDMKNGEIVLGILKELVSEGHTLVMVTHNIDIAKQSGRIIKLVDGEVSFDSSIEENYDPILKLEMTRASEVINDE